MRILLLLLVSLLSLALSAQNQLKGVVISSTDQIKISEANILVVETASGTITDSTGRFVLGNLPDQFTIRISHIGYIEKTISIQQPIDTFLIIRLDPSINELERVIVTPYKSPTPLTNAQEKSIRDFELDDGYIYTIEYLGDFKKQQLSIKDLDGKTVQSLKLKKIKHIRGLHFSCNQDIYLVTRDQAYLVNFENQEIKIEEGITKAKFDKYMEPCKVIDDNTIYYLFHTFNGLKRKVSAYNTQNKTSTTLRIISNEKSLNGYKSDLGFISYHQQQIYLGDIEEQKLPITRSTQATSDFLLNVLYRPKLPVHIFGYDDKLLVFNHPEQSIEFYNTDELIRSVPIEYPALEGWLQEVIQDPVTQQFYILMSYGEDVVVKQINIETGKLQPIVYLKEGPTLIQKVRILDGTLYYTIRDQQFAGSKGLKMINF